MVSSGCDAADGAGEGGGGCVAGFGAESRTDVGVDVMMTMYGEGEQGEIGDGGGSRDGEMESPPSVSSRIFHPGIIGRHGR